MKKLETIKCFFNRPCFLLGLVLAGWLGSLGITLLTACQPLRTDDLFFHLAIGDTLVKERNFPGRDPFLFTADDSVEPIYHEWLFQVITSGLRKLSGEKSLRLWHGFFLLLVLLAVQGFVGGRSPPGQAAVWFFAIHWVFLIFSYQRLIQFRPHLWSVFFLYLGLTLILSGRIKLWPHKSLMLALLMVVWINTHSLAPMLLPFMGVAFFMQVGTHTGFPKGWGIFFKSIFLPVLALMVHPEGPGILFFYWRGNSRNPYHHVIDEWGHFNLWGNFDFLPLSSIVLKVLFLLLFILFVGVTFHLFGNPKRRKEFCEDGNALCLWGWSLMAFGCMFYAVRFVWLIAIPGVFLVVYTNLRFLLKPLRWPVTLVFFLATLWHFTHPETIKYHIPWSSTNQRENYVSWAVDSIKYHEHAVSFLKEIEFQGNIYNPYFLGGYLSDQLSPSCQVFIDGRFEHYSESVNKDYSHILQVVPEFSELLKKYPIDLFFLPLGQKTQRLCLALRMMRWKLIYLDSQTVIFLSPARQKDLETLRHIQRAQGLVPGGGWERLQQELFLPYKREWAFMSQGEGSVDNLDQFEKVMNYSVHYMLSAEALVLYQRNTSRIPLHHDSLEVFREWIANGNQIAVLLGDPEWQEQIQAVQEGRF